MGDRGTNPQNHTRTSGVLRALFVVFFAALFVALVAPSASHAIDLLGRTEATFSWQPSSGAVVSYDVYVACAPGQAPDNFDSDPENVAADQASVTVFADFGDQCKIRVVARDADGRISPLSLSSDLVNFVEPPLADNDFDGDGYSDIIVQGPTDSSALLLSGADLQSGDAFLHQRTTVSTSDNREWEIVGTGDFNGDGEPDFLWSVSLVDSDSGVTTYSFFAGFDINNTTEVFSDVPDTHEIIAIADFNGDGADDILYRTNDLYGTVYVTFMGPQDVDRTSRYKGVLQSQFDFVACGDFDANGKDDVMWRRRETGQAVIWLMTRPGRMTLANSGVLPGSDWFGETAGNFNNSTADDVLWRNIATGEALIWYMDDLEQPEEYWLEELLPDDWRLLATGDINGDGRADLTWLDTDTNLLEVWQMDENEENGFRVE
jgi:hypothetical protein